MRNIKSQWSFGLAALLIAGAAYAADGQSGQQPPKEPDLKECVVDSGGFRMKGKQATYAMELENKCEKRLRCKVALYVTTAFGPAQGQGTLILAPHAAGAAAKKSYAIKVKAMGGMAQGSRSCEVM